MEDQLLEAIRYFETGNKQDAQKQLVQVLKTDPENEYAWLWMALTLEDDPVRKKACLEKVLALNPQNSKANQMLYGIKGQNGRSEPLTPPPTPKPTPKPAPPHATMIEAAPPLANTPTHTAPINWDDPFDSPTFVEMPLPPISDAFQAEPIGWDDPVADEEQAEGEETAVFTNTIGPYDQVNELLEPHPDPREQAAESQRPPATFNLGKLFIILGIILFASALYAVSVLLLVKDDLLTTPTAENPTVALVESTATNAPTATAEATAVPVIVSEPTTTPVPPTATPTSQPTNTAEPTAPAESGTIPSADLLPYLQTARDTAAPLQTAVTQIIQLVAEVDFANEQWKNDLLAATATINTAHGAIKLLTPPPAAQMTHEQLLTTSSDCYAAATYLEEGTNNDDIEAMQPAATHLADCRDGLDTLNTIWNTLPIDLATATPESSG